MSTFSYPMFPRVYIGTIQGQAKQEIAWVDLIQSCLNQCLRPGGRNTMTLVQKEIQNRSHKLTDWGRVFLEPKVQITPLATSKLIHSRHLITFLCFFRGGPFLLLFLSRSPSAARFRPTLHALFLSCPVTGGNAVACVPILWVRYVCICTYPTQSIVRMISSFSYKSQGTPLR